MVLVLASGSAALALPLRPRAGMLADLGLDHQRHRTIALGMRGLRLRVRDSIHTAPMLLIGTAVRPLHRLQITRLGAAHRLARWLRFAPVAATGDAGFDRRVLVDCDYSELPQVVLRDAAARDAAAALLAAGARELRLAGGRLEARFALADLTRGTAPQAQLERWATAVAAFADTLPAFTGALSPITPAWPARRLLLLAACTLLPAVALLSLVLAYDAWRPIDAAALAWEMLRPLPLVASAALATGLLLGHGHPASGRLLPPLALAIVLAAPSGLLAWTLYRNGSGEPTAIEHMQFDVTGTARLRETGGARHLWYSDQLQLRGLFGGLHPLQAEIPQSLWQDQPPDGARIRAEIAPGRLGHRWIAAAAAEWTARPAAAPASPPAAPSASAAAGTPQIVATLPLPAGSAIELLVQARLAFGEGNTARGLGLIDRALAAPDAAALPADRRAAAHMDRALAYSEFGESFDRLREADTRAVLALQPAHLGAALLLDELLFRNARHDEALLLWNNVLVRRPADLQALSRRARVLAVLGREADARKDATAACDGGHADACALLASF